jgi:hypothetical protein
MATIKPACSKWGMRAEKSTNQFLMGGRMAGVAHPRALEYLFAGFAGTMVGISRLSRQAHPGWI